jgi:hypothetical protein
MPLRISLVDIEKTLVVLEDKPKRRIILEDPPLLFTPKV